MTKKEKKMFQNVCNSDACFLEDLYDYFPWEYELRRRIYVENCNLVDGEKFALIDVPGHSFSCGFLYYDMNNKLKCKYFTEKNTFDFKVD